jgi:hypothetical protein
MHQTTEKGVKSRDPSSLPSKQSHLQGKIGLGAEEADRTEARFCAMKPLFSE